MHFRALRRDCSDLSSDTAVSPYLSSGERTVQRMVLFPAVARAQVPQQAYQPQQFVPTGIRHGAILQIPRLPEGQVITAAGRVPGQGTSTGRPAEYVDDVRTVLVDDHRRALMIQVVCAPANEAVTLLPEVGDHRRNIGMAGKPGLHRVLVGGHHVDQMRWQDRKSTRLNSSHGYISYAVFCLKKKN